jgi:uncharacterized protein YdaU (DUF1376 family)
MPKSPAFQLYPKDALADTLHLSPEEFTAYWRLVFQAWIGVDDFPQGYLSGDEAKLRSMTALTPSQWKRARQSALRLFKKNGAGYYHKRLVAELEKQADRRERGRRGGVESSKQKASKGQAKGKQRASKGQAKGQAKGNTPICSLQSALPDVQEETAIAVSCARPSPAMEASIDRTGFEAFWSAYPRKVGKLKAAKAWRDTAKERPSLAVILESLRRMAATPQWRQEGGRYAPHPATWLHRGGWDDDPGSATPARGTGAEVDEQLAEWAK